MAPQLGGTLTRVAASHEAARGLVATAWSRDGDRARFELEVPPGATAEVVLPGGDAREGDVPLADADGISDVRTTARGIAFTAASGSYAFDFAM